MARKFYGWWVTAAAFVTFGLAVGVPYYNIGFFYDYFQREFGWSRSDITSGLSFGGAAHHLGGAARDPPLQSA